LDQLGRPSAITRVLKSGRGRQKRRPDPTTRDTRRTPPATASFEAGGRGHDVRKWGQPPEAGKGKETDPPLEAPKRNIALRTPLCLAP